MGQAIAWCGFVFNIGCQTRADCPMPRPWRIEYHGAIYHVLSRGDRREKIFLDGVDRQDVLKTPAEWRMGDRQVAARPWRKSGGADHRRGVEPVGLDGGRTGSGTPECPRENGHRHPVAASNDAAPQMDCGAHRLGDVQECQCEVTPMAEEPPQPHVGGFRAAQSTIANNS
jgi:hypothetical protein